MLCYIEIGNTIRKKLNHSRKKSWWKKSPKMWNFEKLSFLSFFFNFWQKFPNFAIWLIMSRRNWKYNWKTFKLSFKKIDSILMKRNEINLNFPRNLNLCLFFLRDGELIICQGQFKLFSIVFTIYMWHDESNGQICKLFVKKRRNGREKTEFFGKLKFLAIFSLKMECQFL